MKHIFSIHSHTVFLTSLGVINVLKLDSEEIVFVYARNYKNELLELPYKHVDLSMEYEYCHRKPYYFKGFKSIISHIDEKVGMLTNNDKYILFVPNGGARFFQIIISNKNCLGMNYIQEGALAFDKLFSSKKTIKYYIYELYDIIIYPFYKHRIWASFRWTIPPFMKKNKKAPECYAISSDIFRKLPYHNNIISWPHLELKTNIEPSYPCFIFESSIEMGVIEKNIYMMFSKKLIEEKSEGMNYIKFHPAQTKENMTEIISYFEQIGKKYEILSMNTPFEIYLTTNRNMKVYGFNSSLLIFAKDLQHQVYSLESELLLNSKRYYNWRERL